MCHQIFDNFIVSVETGRSQWCRVRPCRAVNICVVLHQQLDDAEMSGGSCAPERRRPFDRLPVEGDRSRLFHVRVAFVEQILHHVKVSIAAGDDEWRRTPRPHRDQSLNFRCGASMQVALIGKKRRRWRKCINLRFLGIFR